MFIHEYSVNDMFIHEYSVNNCIPVENVWLSGTGCFFPLEQQPAKQHYSGADGTEQR